MRKRLRSGTAAALALPVVLLAGCGGGSGATGAPGAAAGDGTISYAFSVGPTTLDPARISSLQEVLYLNPVYDRLVYLDPVTGDAGPMLATAWQVGSDEQGGFVDFTLRAGLSFPDGAAFGPDTVVANIQRSKAAKGSGVASDLAAVSGAEKRDDNTVRLRTPGGAAWIPSVLGGRAGMMISQDALDAPDLATKPVGIGMWQLDRFDPSIVTYQATPGYWDSQAQASKRLELRFIPDDSARFNAVRSGDIDTTFIRPSQIKDAKAAGIDVVEVPGATTYAFHMNTATPGLDDVRVRRALQKAVNRDAVSEQLLNGKCTSNDQLWAPALSSHADDVPVYPYDPAAARQELAAAGHANDLEVKLATADIDQYRRLAEILQAQFGEVGVKVAVQVAPASALRDLFGIRKAADMALSNTGLESDPSQLVSEYLAPDGLFNPGGSAIPGVQELAAQALGESDAAKRASLYQQISTLARDNAGYLSICSPAFLFATSDQVSGFKGARAAGLPEWRGVSG